jgi:hypothetical protein
MKTELQKCISLLLEWGLVEEMIDVDRLERDLLWWEDVDMTCVMYVDSVLV